MAAKYRYEAVAGYFVHDDPASFPDTAVPPRFGLKDDSDNRWTSFFEGIRKLNEDAVGTKKKTVYKFFLLARHGQGYHNVAEVQYGNDEWNRYWSLLDGDGKIVWGPDPELTPVGVDQARDIHERWETEASFGFPAPHVRYCSPMIRALHTAEVIFDGTYESYPSRVTVKENCREQNGMHTCDKRKNVSGIVSRFPAFEIEAGMDDEDRLWQASVRETREEVAVRAKIILDCVFESCDVSESFVSITAHSGFMNGFLMAIGREAVVFPTGAVLPVVVKAEHE